MRIDYYKSLIKKLSDNNITNGEVDDLQKWINDDKSFNEFADETWEHSSMDLDVDLKKRIFSNINSEISDLNHRKNSKTFKIMRIAAFAAIILFSSLLVYNYKGKDINNSDLIVKVDKGQKAGVTLPDGTKVLLNSDSRLDYGKDYNDKDRIVELEGEAYFDVAKDKNRPFIVKSGNYSVEALGTKFNVHAYKNENYISTSLIQGKVKVSINDKCDILNPNEEITYNLDDNRLQKTYKNNIERSTLWTKNEISFNNRTLESISKELERMYNVKISFESDEIKGYSFNGTLKNSNLDTILNLLVMTSDIRYRKSENSIIFYKSKF